MILGEHNLDFRELGLQFLRQNRADRVLCVKMACVDQVDAQLLSIPELIIFYIRSYKGIAAGIHSVHEFACTGTAAYGYGVDRLAGTYIA